MVLVLSTAKITVREEGQVRVEGWLKRYSARIEAFVEELGLRHVTIHHRSGRFRFSRGIDVGTRQKIRNFLVNECPFRA